MIDAVQLCRAGGKLQQQSSLAVLMFYVSSKNIVKRHTSTLRIPGFVRIRHMVGVWGPLYTGGIIVIAMVWRAVYMSVHITDMLLPSVLTALLLLSTVQAGIMEEPEDSCVCPTSEDDIPVCGSNQISYPNRCWLDVEVDVRMCALRTMYVLLLQCSRHFVACNNLYLLHCQPRSYDNFVADFLLFLRVKPMTSLNVMIYLLLTTTIVDCTTHQVEFACEGPCPCVEDCICPAYVDVVCGADGNEYSNPCYAKCAGQVMVILCKKWTESHLTLVSLRIRAHWSSKWVSPASTSSQCYIMLHVCLQLGYISLLMP